MKNAIVLALVLVSSFAFANENKGHGKKEVPAACKELKGKAKKECMNKEAGKTETATAPAATEAAPAAHH